ncbi:MAG: site-specific integrase [Oscillospiraceae bacterium]|nr:site-specific integrase [Oscillospiraceae bacterium]
MKCKYCGYSGIPDGSFYCNMCGKQVKRNRVKEKAEIKVPEPYQKADGSYAVRLMIDGHRHTIDGSTKEECTAKAIAFKSGILKVPKADRKTLGQVIDTYIDSCSNRSPATLRGYNVIRNNRFQKYMDCPLTNIRDWQKVLDEESKTCGPKTLKNAWGLVSPALEYSGYEVPKVRLPKMIKPDKKYLNPEQIKAFVNIVKDEPYGIGAMFALHSLRRSEIFDLTWEDVDLENDIIHVRGAAVIAPNGEIIHKHENKTECSKRDVPIMIPELKDALEKADKTTEYVVPMPGKTQNYLYKAINSMCVKNGLPEVGVHGLRHSFASLAYHLGIPVEITCKMGGWSGPKTVMDIYTHLYEEDVMKNQNKMKTFYSAEKAENQ